ncbi:hypothetical protein [Shimia biformata]|uniref:hypothetical protein n=1 Tax=Shimia biformata TaxID=1294299 RepID=UPI00194E070F|nr:hypothetical protein [Shimia biformata]
MDKPFNKKNLRMKNGLVISKIRRSLLALPIGLIAGLWAETAVSQSPYEPREVWDRTAETFNMSSFSYMDRNENGDYDLGDQPLAGIVFVLAKDGVERWRATANENGFANFPGSRVVPGTALYELGDYTFEALIPEGWTVTSNNTLQTRRFIDVPGASMGGGLVEMMEPVGLVPQKSISGVLETEDKLMISGPDFPLQEVARDGNKFEVVVPRRGTYVLTAGDVSRTVEIAEFPVTLGTLKPGSGMEGAQSTLTFDDISANWLRKVPSGYGGLKWFNINSIKNSFPSGSRGYVNGATSGSFVAYTSSGHPASISHPDGFDFVQVNLAVAWPPAQGETAIFEFWRGDEKVATDHVQLSAYAPVVYAPHMSNVTKVRVHTLHYWQMVMDDLVVGVRQ